MRECYRHIFRTYVRRKMFWLSTAALLAVVFHLLVAASHRDRHPFTVVPVVDAPRAGQIEMVPTSLPAAMDPAMRKTLRDSMAALAESRMAADITTIRFSLMAAAWFLATVLIHVKQQIASPRAVLVPGYRVPHLVVGAAGALPVFLLLPLLISMAFGTPLLPVLATGILFFVLILWGIYLQTGPLMWICILLWVGISLPPGQRALGVALTQTPLLLSLVLIGASLAALCQLARRLMALREEMPEYARAIATNRWETFRSGRADLAGGATVNYQSRMQQLLAAPGDRCFARLGAGPLSGMARLRRWSLTSMPPRFVWIFGLTLVVMALMYQHMALKFAYETLLPQVALFPAILLPGLALRIWPTLGYESLRPLSRAAYFRERALAVALQTAQVWLALAVTFIACTAALGPAALRQPDFWLSLAGTAFVQVPALAWSFWILRFRSPLLVIGASGVGVGIIFPAITIIEPAHRLIPLAASTVLLAAAAIAMVSALILYDAYRRWLRTDLA